MALALALAVTLAARLAAAQVVTAPAMTEPTSSPAESSAESAAAAVDAPPKPSPPPATDTAELEAEQANLDKLRGLYDTAAGLLGKQHVVVTPVVFAGKRCTDGTNVFSCTTIENHGGIAGLVIMPLFGAGGGHGADFWPVIETDDVAAEFYRFDKQFRRLRDLVSKQLVLPDDQKAPPEVLQKRFDSLASAFDSLLKRDSQQDKYYAPDVKRLQDCFAAVVSAPVAGDDPSTPSDDPSKPKKTPANFCSDGMARAGKAGGWTLRQKLQLLDALWHEHDLLVDAVPPARHNFLIGPLAGVSITDRFGDILYGGGFELGWKQYLRATLSGGLRSSMHGKVEYGTMDRVGWWIGIGLSGQLGDQFVNGVIGAERVLGGNNATTSETK